MIIDYTSKEREALQKIQREYKQRILDITDAIDKTEDGSPERKALINERAQIRLQLTNDIEAYSDRCERKRFKKLGADPEAILDSAREQIPRLLEYEYNELTAHATQEDLKGMKLADAEGGRILLKANFMAQVVMYELKLHIAALQQDKPRLQELFALIIEGVENSPYTNNEEITLDAAQQKPVEVIRFRRSPLADITTYGLMNDKANAQMIQDEGIFTQTANGQITLRWVVNQAPQKADKEVPVYIALSYNGAENGANGELTKKLNLYDESVYNSLSNIFFYWARENPQKPLYVSREEIWRGTTGKQSRNGSAKPSAYQLKKIGKSIDKMRHIDFYMDITEELKANYITLDDERLVGGYLKDYLLNCTEATFFTERGRKISGYRVNSEPVLYTYNAAKGHVIMLPLSLLDTSAFLSDSEYVIEFKQYLLQQILLMKNGIRNNRKIKLSTLYTATGVTPPEERLDGRKFSNEATRQQAIRRTRKADRGKVEGILAAWTAKGWITGYTALNSKNKPVKEKQTVAAYEIHYKKEAIEEKN